MTNKKIQIAAGTNVGLVRQNNEDNFVVNKDLTKSEWLVPRAGEEVQLGEYGSLIVVADGMGGANAGEVASAIAIETVQTLFVADNLINVVSDADSIDNYLREVIKEADLNITTRSKTDSSTHGMGTTIVICWIIGGEAHVAWCGDSRCYLFRNDNFMRVSKDHSYVQGLVDEGKLTEEEAFDHPYSNVITRCLGSEDERADPDTRTVTLNDGDLFLLCTDGLCGLCRDDEIMSIVQDNRDNLGDCRDALINAALEAGGHDNVTLALARIDMANIDDEDKENPMSSDSNLTTTADVSPSSASDAETKPLENMSQTLPVNSRISSWKIILFLLVIVIICMAGYIYVCPEILEKMKHLLPVK